MSAERWFEVSGYWLQRKTEFKRHLEEVKENLQRGERRQGRVKLGPLATNVCGHSWRAMCLTISPTEQYCLIDALLFQGFALFKHHATLNDERGVVDKKHENEIVECYKRTIYRGKPSNQQDKRANSSLFWQSRLGQRLEERKRHLQNLCPSGQKEFVSVRFRIERPVTSKDDTNWYVIDNPMRKEWVFQVPYIAGTQWKGMLRQALMRDLANFHQEYRKNPTENPFASLLNLKNKTDLTTGELFARARFRLFLLFGAEKESEPDQPREVTKFLNKAGGEDAQKRFRELVAEHFGCKDDPARLIVVLKRFRGRLVFLPTFFNRLGIEVLNPQDRATGAGKGPIWLETVPPGTTGELRILRVPFDLIALQKDEKICDKEEKHDKAVMLFGVARLLGHYGIGAKTSTSFGLCRVATQWLRFLIEEAHREAEEEAKRRQSSEIQKWFVQKLAEKIKEYVGRSNRVERRE